MAAIGSTAQILENTIRFRTDLARLLLRLGVDLQAEGVRDTPTRFVKSLLEMTGGYQVEAGLVLSRVFHTYNDQMIVVRDIEFTSLCEHHLLPFYGTADIGYLPFQGKIVGLSKIPRLVQAFAMRLQTQENMTQQIAEALMQKTGLEPLGVGVVVRGVHLCLRHRGARQPRAEMITSCMLGEFRDKTELREEFLGYVRSAK